MSLFRPIATSVLYERSNRFTNFMHESVIRNGVIIHNASVLMMHVANTPLDITSLYTEILLFAVYYLAAI